MGEELTGFEQMPIPGVSGGRWALDGPDRIVLHTTEGGNIEGAFAAYRKSKAAPHFTIDLGKRRQVQHISLNRSASAMRNEPGGVETNRVGRTIQIEIVGRAESPDRSKAELQFLAGVLTAIKAAGVNFEWTAPEFHVYPPPMRLGKEPWRMSSVAWLQFNGICGHQHVPENVHGDPGAMDINEVIRLATGTKENNEMAVLAQVEGDPQVWCVSTMGRFHVGNPKALDFLRFFGVVNTDIVPIKLADKEILDGIPICAQ
jgi:hypothetical protein